MIELLNLKSLNAAMQNDIDAAVLRVARSGRYILGPEVDAFEREWAAYCGVAHCVGTGNALDALRLILMAAGIGPGDEVIVAANTYIATWLAVSLVGATPVPVDADYASMNIDAGKVAKAFTPRTRAILATHLYGLPADVMGLNQAVGGRNIFVFADAAQAHGAMHPHYGRAGQLCAAEAFSFYPSKNLGAMGDAGCITTPGKEYASRMRRLRNYGGVGRLDHTVKGINSRLDEMQAAILRAKLPYLDQMNFAREQRARIYNDRLHGCRGLTLPPAGGNYHQYVIRSANRDALRKELAERGVDAHVHYPVPPYLEPAYAGMGLKRGAFPVTERLADEVLSLPIGYSCDVETVARVVADCCRPKETARAMDMALANA